MHNTAYKAIGLDNEFNFTKLQVLPKDLKSTIDRLKKQNIRGITCTIPHKVKVMQYLDKIDSVAKKIAAVNTVVNDNGILTGYNTDWLGMVTSLEQVLGKGGIKNKSVAIIGAGGAARAMAYGIVESGGNLTIYNRTISKAEILASELDAKYDSIDNINNVKDTDIIINATSLGMGKQKHLTPVPQKLITNKHICFDAVYIPQDTRFLKEAKHNGATIIYGLEMLLHQGTTQFELYTNHKAPEDVMRKSLLKHFGIK